MRAIDLYGKRFGRLTVISFSGVRKLRDGKSYRYWNCVCDCLQEVTVSAGSLNSGQTLSCGCWQKQRAAEAQCTHGKTTSPEFNVWVKMRQRCSNPKDKSFNDYGGRGIEVCPRWNKFENFIADMGPRPTPAHSIERTLTQPVRRGGGSA